MMTEAPRRAEDFRRSGGFCAALRRLTKRIVNVRVTGEAILQEIG